jgi:hypothetical protein
MEEERAVRGLETTHDLRGGIGDANAHRTLAHDQKNPSAFGE